MTTMLDKCAVAGDITQAIDRRGAWTVALTVIGGTANTAVKIQSAPSASGVFTDFKTLISADDADKDQYKGFVVDLHGADKFIKVTGAVMATAVLGDCDHDIKDVTIKAGEVPSGAELENNKAATIDVSAYTEPVEVSPSEGYDGMKKTTVTLSNIPEIEANKAQTIDVSTYTEPVEIEPTEGKDGMAKATVTLSNIPQTGATLYAWSTPDLATIDYKETAIAPDNLADFKSSKVLEVDSLRNLSVKTEETAVFRTNITSYEKISDTSFKIIDDGDEYIYTRDSTNDVTIW